MPAGSPRGAGGSGSLARRLRAARRQGFVGRAEDVERFRAALDGDDGTAAVHLVHGPGGIGKTALLGRLAHEADDAGRTVVHVEATALDPDPQAFEEAAATALTRDRPVLLVDDVDRCPVLEHHLRDDFLLRLPDDAVVVLAGRTRPGAEWTADPGWRELVRLRRLPPLADDEAATILRRRDVPRRQHAALLRFAGGVPLALSLAADDAAGEAEWSPGRHVVRTLLARVVDPPLDPEQDLALRVCAHAQHTTVDLLRTVLDDERATAAFAWLSGLSFVGTGPHGLVPDDLVRRLVDSDHRWRDPRGYEDLHRLLWRHLGDRALDSTGEASRAAVGDLVHLQRYRHPDRAESGALATAEEIVELDLGGPAATAAAVRELADVTLGPDARKTVEHWLERQPEAFHVYGRPGGRPTTFLAWLRLQVRDAAEADADPVVAAAWALVDDGDALQPDEELGVLRYVVPRPRTAHLAATDPRLLTWYAELFARAGRLAASFVVLDDHVPAVPFVTGLDHHLHTEVAEGDDTWGLFLHDWRRVPMAMHVERVLPPVGVTFADDDGAAPPPITRETFEDAVRQALRDWHEDDALAANLLTRTGFAAERVPGDPVASVRGAVEAAVTDLQDDPRRVKAYRALAATYLHQSATQEAAAARLGVPFSTYRRHLGKGIALVCDRLWSQSQGVS